jgi:hypothetical protein
MSTWNSPIKTYSQPTILIKRPTPMHKKVCHPIPVCCQSQQAIKHHHVMLM